MSDQRIFGVIGLGKMGGNLAIQASEKGYEVYGLDTKDLRKEVLAAGVKQVKDYQELAQNLPAPRAILIYVPAGKIIDTIIDDLSGYLEEGDIIMESGNSYWGDSITRAKRMEEKGIYYIDCGTSGGIDGARNGACFMAGGKDEAIQQIQHILKDMAVEDGFVHTGPSGTGHFVKLVHNGIEFGMLQAIGEGISLLEKFDHNFDMEKILHNWNHGSVIRSWLVELLEEQYKKRGGMEDVPPYIEDTGEVNWLVGDAMKMEVPVPVISQSVMQLFTSRDNKQKWARAIAMMRNGFGGHPLGENEHIRKKRQNSKVGPYSRYKDVKEKVEEDGQKK